MRDTGLQRPLALVGLAALASGRNALAQDMLRYLDLNSPAMTQAEMTRAEVEAQIQAARGKPLDLSGKRLSGLDLSGLDFSRADLRAARLNNANLTKARLDGAALDLVWAMKADFSGASLSRRLAVLISDAGR